VTIQLRIANGESLAAIGLEQTQVPKPRGFAIQMRINAERMGPDGSVRPSTGNISTFEPPSGRGLRVDSFLYNGYASNSSFDSLLAKLIVHSLSSDFSPAVRKAYRALCEFKIQGVTTNIALLQNLLRHADFAANRIHTNFIQDRRAARTKWHRDSPFLFRSASDERDDLAPPSGGEN